MLNGGQVAQVDPATPNANQAGSGGEVAKKAGSGGSTSDTAADPTNPQNQGGTNPQAPADNERGSNSPTPTVPEIGPQLSPPAEEVFQPFGDAGSKPANFVPDKSVFQPVDPGATPTSPQQSPPANEVFLPVGDGKKGDTKSAPAEQILPGTGSQSGQQQPVQEQNRPNVATPGASPQVNAAPAVTIGTDAQGQPITAAAASTTGADGKARPVATATGPLTGPITGTAVGENFVVNPGGIIVIDGSTFNTATATTATLRNGKIVKIDATGAASIQDKEAPTGRAFVTKGDYIIGCFLPTILAVIFTIPWHILASAVKEIEPFHQLHKPEGATADKSLALTYRASVNFVSTINAMINGHYLVWWSGLCSLIVLILAPLSSETVFLAYVGSSNCDPFKSRETCIPQVSVFPLAARIVQGILAFVAILTFGLLIALFRLKTGVYANPLSIATLAALFQDQRVVDDFRKIESYYPPEAREFRKTLEGQRYRIGQYVDSDRQHRYGLYSLSEAPYDPHPNKAAPPPYPQDQPKHPLFAQKTAYTSVSVNPLDDPDPLSPHAPRFLAPQDRKRPREWFTYTTHTACILLFTCSVLGLLFLLIYYNALPNTRAFEQFMTSGSFGVNFLFTSLGVVIKMYWTVLDDDIRLNAPYRLLHRGPMTAQRTILVAPANNPWTGIWSSLRRREWLGAYTALVAILCEPLIVCLANVPFKPNLAYQAYVVSTWLSTAILGLMIVGIIWILAKRYGDTRGMGGGYAVRAPETVAGQLWLMCASHLREGFVDMSEMGRTERDECVTGWGKRYAIGGVVGVDGQEREGVDESDFVVGEGGI